MTRPCHKIRIFLCLFIILVFFNSIIALGVADVIHGPKEWLKNNDFSTQDFWVISKSIQGDNSTVDASIQGGQGNLKILGESHVFSEVSGVPNSSTSIGWKKVRNDGFLYPDSSGIDSQGCFVTHTWSEDTNQFPSVHFRKNISLSSNMLRYNITSVSLNATFNATVNSNVEAHSDNVTAQYYAIGDFVRFYIQISDLNYSNPYTVALYKTRYLGQNTPSILSISNRLIDPYGDNFIITALNSAFEKDPDHSNFTLTLGIDIYSEDNVQGTDTDTYDSLIIKSCNFSFAYERKIEKFTSISIEQEGDEIKGENIQIKNAYLSFKYKIDNFWPTARSSFSEIRALINNNQFRETILLSEANQTLQEAKLGGYDVTYLILKDVNITVSIQVFIANTFGWDNNITISVDDVHLLIKYIELEPGVNVWPLVISLSIGIILLAIGFLLYQKIFKYPPIIRKTRKLKRKIQKRRKLRSLEIKSRDEILKINLDKKFKKLNLEQESYQIQNTKKKLKEE